MQEADICLSYYLVMNSLYNVVNHKYTLSVKTRDNLNTIKKALKNRPLLAFNVELKRSVGSIDIAKNKNHILEMILQLTSVICSLTLLQEVVSQRGEFASFGHDVDSVFSKMTKTNVRDEPGGHRSILWTLPKSFTAFGHDRTQIRVR